MEKKILLVEDDDFLRKLYIDVLKGDNYNVDFAIDGEEALVKIKQGGYDLVLLDIMLPKMDGLEIMRSIKKSPPSNPNKKIIFLTNLDNEKELEEVKNMEIDYIIKSEMTPDEFLEKVKGYLR